MSILLLYNEEKEEIMAVYNPYWEVNLWHEGKLLRVEERYNSFNKANQARNKLNDYFPYTFVTIDVVKWTGVIV